MPDAAAGTGLAAGGGRRESQVKKQQTGKRPHWSRRQTGTRRPCSACEGQESLPGT